MAIESQDGWRLVSVAGSYSEYLGTVIGADDDQLAEKLLSRSRDLVGHPVSLVTIDMPLARTPISARRVSDDAVSRAYGARHASTHTPSRDRPGPISDLLTTGFARLGYDLLTRYQSGCLAEVYPHPALIELMSAPRRLPYKYSKVAKYWPEIPRAERLLRLHAVWAEIVTAMDRHLIGTADLLGCPPPAGGKASKRFEDMLDAVICAVVGVHILTGRATGFGDDISAIWVPTPAPVDVHLTALPSDVASR